MRTPRKRLRRSTLHSRDNLQRPACSFSKTYTVPGSPVRLSPLSYTQGSQEPRQEGDPRSVEGMRASDGLQGEDPETGMTEGPSQNRGVLWRPAPAVYH